MEPTRRMMLGSLVAGMTVEPVAKAQGVKEPHGWLVELTLKHRQFGGDPYYFVPNPFPAKCLLNDFWTKGNENITAAEYIQNILNDVNSGNNQFYNKVVVTPLYTA